MSTLNIDLSKLPIEWQRFIWHNNYHITPEILEYLVSVSSLNIRFRNAEASFLELATNPNMTEQRIGWFLRLIDVESFKLPKAISIVTNEYTTQSHIDWVIELFGLVNIDIICDIIFEKEMTSTYVNYIINILKYRPYFYNDFKQCMIHVEYIKIFVSAINLSRETVIKIITYQNITRERIYWASKIGKYLHEYRGQNGGEDDNHIYMMSTHSCATDEAVDNILYLIRDSNLSMEEIGRITLYKHFIVEYESERVNAA